MDQVFSFLGWSFVPSYATAFLQSIYYKLTIPVGRVPPQPGTAIYAKHHRRIRILVLTLYLVYTLLQSLYDVKLAGDFFTLLNLNPNASEREVKSRFRRLAAKYHPDKVRNEPDTLNPKSAQDMHYLLLKTAQDTLLSPPLRYAYTRFGPGVTHLQSPVAPTIRSYVLAGIQHNLIPSYIMNTLGLLAMNYLFLPKWGSYWRYLALSSIVVIEMYFLTHSDTELSNLIPSFLPITHMYSLVQSRTKLSRLLPPHLLPYQILVILRKLSISLNIFISQLAPPRAASAPNVDSAASTTAILTNVGQKLSQLHAIAMRTDAESTSLLNLQMLPFKGDEVQVSRLREGMKEGMITAAIRQHPEVREAVNKVIERRKRAEQQQRTEAGKGVKDGI